MANSTSPEVNERRPEGADIPTLKVGTGWLELHVIGEPTVRQNYKGYAPVLPVRAVQTGLDYFLYISAKSLAEQLEPLRQENAGSFVGLRFRIRKQSTDQFAPYELVPSS